MIEDFTRVLTRGQHDDPFAVLGSHCVTNESGPTVAVRAFLPMAATITLRPTTDQVLPQEMQRLHPDGVFEALCCGQTALFPYQLEIVHQNGKRATIDDPYRFPSTLSQYDLYLMGEGTHYQQYEKFGAHQTAIDGVAGVVFIV